MVEDPANQSPSGARRGISIGPDDWPDQAADQVVDLVDRVKGYTTDNAVRAIRGVVYGLVIFVLAIAAILLTVVVLVRLADAYLPIGSGVGDATWAAHLFIGTLLSVLGLGAWGSRGGSGTPKALQLAVIVDVVIITSVVVVAIVGAFV